MFVCGVKDDEFWRMTDAQIWGVHYGYEINKEQEASNFRTLLHAYVSANNKKKISAKNLWPLPYLDFIEEDNTPKISKENQNKILENVNKMFVKLDSKNIC